MVRVKPFVMGIVSGSAAGALYVLFSTPSSGQEFRSNAVSKSKELNSLLRRSGQDGKQFKDQVTETSKDTLSLIRHLSEDISSSVEGWKQTIAPHQKEIQKYLEQIEENLADLEEKAKQHRTSGNEETPRN
ncbi:MULTISPECIES: YtxH domain-containing protein [Salimicrobium]|uniref:Gas vesicle protein n=2 Tax=Salimicrobium TaxID=351195 RepID=A0ABY1KMS6_9BACI|nr:MULTISPECIES: YtxH domain-containing protein [Salimicrobium]SDX46957.1 Gas vesicle protein [Salimicrobium album]SIS44605.1 Gas vesicle protein [Salimicrobium salexigens]